MEDFHGHLYHPDWYPKKFQHLIAKDFLTRKKKVATEELVAKTLAQMNKMLCDRDGTKTIRLLDYANIKSRIILILDFGLELGEANSSIEQIHEEVLDVCNKYPNRLIGFAGLDPRRNNAKNIFKNAVLHQNAKGLKLHPTGGWGLLDRGTIELVSIAADHGLPVLSHIGKTVEALRDENAQPLPFIKLAKLFPQISFIAGHSGFGLWREFVTLKDQVPHNMFFDISGWQELVINDGSNIVEDISTLMNAFPDRIGFGTDSPFYGYNLPYAEKNWVELTNKAITKDSKWATIEKLYQI